MQRIRDHPCAGGSNESRDSAALPTQYRLVRAEGTHRELGRQHGEQAAEQIRAHLDHIGRSRDQLQSQALQFKPLFEILSLPPNTERGAALEGRREPTARPSDALSAKSWMPGRLAGAHREIVMMSELLRAAWH